MSLSTDPSVQGAYNSSDEDVPALVNTDQSTTTTAAAAKSLSQHEDESDFSGSDSASDSEDDLDAEWDAAEEDDEEVEPLQCFFCDHSALNAVDFLAHLKEKHNFDFQHIKEKLKLDFYGVVRAINLIRTKVKENDSCVDIIQFFHNATSTDAWLTSDALLRPVMTDDAVLFSLPSVWKEEGEEEDELEAKKEEDEIKKTHHVSVSLTSTANIEELDNNSVDALSLNAEKKDNRSPADMSQEIAALHEERHVLWEEIGRMREMISTMSDAMKRIAFNDDSTNNLPTSTSSSSSSTAASTAAAAAADVSVPGANASRGGLNVIDRDYFGGYSEREIHETMLRDWVRTNAYRDFMYENSAKLFKNKVVLDVGCGTGILSLFAAKSGARKVFAVDAAHIVHKTREIIKLNKFDHVITVIQGKIEEVTIPEQVDIIISEWMGYFLLFESMLPSVLFARDKWLRQSTPEHPTGVYPDKAIMFISGMDSSRSKKEKQGFWQNCYGFDLSPMIEAEERVLGSSVEVVRPSDIVTSTAAFKHIDILTVKDEELDFVSEFALEVQSNSSSTSSTSTDFVPFSAFCVHFDTPFEAHCDHRVNLSTAPSARTDPFTKQPDTTTHWQQTVFHLPQTHSVKVGDKITGKLVAKRGKKNHRSYAVTIEYNVPNHDEKQSEKKTLAFVQSYEVS